MKLSLVFELLLIFILIAFAASKSIKNEKNINKSQVQHRDDNNDGDKIEENPINRYCKCVETHCNCCRDFRLPLVELNGPGCASLMYLNGDKMSVSLSFGKKVITNRTLSSRKPSPVCMPLPGGISKFCGRVYNIARAGEEFRACLGLELQSRQSVEAAVRVSCFKFGPRGVTSEPADPLPLVPQNEKKEEEEEDDDDEEYDDAFGLGGDDDDDEDDDDDDDDDGTLDAVNDVGSDDYTGFSLLEEDLLGDLFGSSGEKKPKKPNKKQAGSYPTTKRPKRPTKKPIKKPNLRTTTPKPTKATTVKTRPSGNRRPIRKPVRKVTPKPVESTTPVPTPQPSVTSAATEKIQANDEMVPIMSTVQDHPITPAVSVPPSAVKVESPEVSVLPVITTPKSVTDFEDAGLEMSLAHITGQLSALPVTPLLPNEGKDSDMVKEVEQTNYEKIETITPRVPSTIPYALESEEVDDEMVKVVDSLDSQETVTEKEPVGDESRGHAYSADAPVSYNEYEGFTIKKHNNNEFNLEDLDVLDLGKIGESLGDELGIFGKNRKNKEYFHKEHVDMVNSKEHEKNDDYDDLVDAIGHTLLMDRRSDKGNKRDRRRQNKMMRGEWSSQPMAS